MSVITITKLYDNLTSSLGKENAENITTYTDHKINTEMENKIKILATKEDLRYEVSRLDVRISETKVDLVAMISETKADLVAMISETKVHLIARLSETKMDLDARISQTHVDLVTMMSKANERLIKWMVGIFITLSIMILGLYFKK